MGHSVRLADGTTVTVEPGSVLPANLHPDVEYYSLPGASIPAVKDNQIFIRTKVAMRDNNVRHDRGRPVGETKHVLECAGRSIRNAMPGHNKVYASMMRGERRGKKKWQDLIDDLNIVLSHQLASGETHKVLLEEPEVTTEDGWATIRAPLFFMRL